MGCLIPAPVTAEVPEEGVTVARATTGVVPVDVTDAAPVAGRDVNGGATEADGDIFAVVSGGLPPPDPGEAGTGATGTGEAETGEVGPAVRTVGSDPLASSIFTTGVAGGAETTGMGFTVGVGAGVGV